MTEIFGRFDFDVIARWVVPGERVLDLGCGDGALLAFLNKERGIHGYGVDKDPKNLLAAIGNGVNVLQFDLEEGLKGFENDAFDHVIMSLSLQAVHHTERMLREMLRVGREAVVSFPNFGHRSHREAISRGIMPVSESLPYQWYNSPNVRFFTIADFETLCADHDIVIHEGLFFDEGRRVEEDPNLNADVALYRLGRLGKY
ncbi:MAG: methionine biosynthesis protein MetW [Betaproteobacteria bacterium]|nr:methionine biosynthesis protein MetW [Betaproteobacteria bacterium]